MKLKEFILTEAIVPELKAKDRDGAIRELVLSLALAGGLPESSVDEVVAALVKRIGSRLRLSCGVRAIQQLERGCRVALASGEVATADAVVVTCDAPAIGRLLGPRLVPPSDLDVPAAPIAVVCMGYPSTAIPRPLDGFGFLAPRRAGVRILGAVWESSVLVGRIALSPTIGGRAA